ncbi:hypothetical protein AKO1_014244 [Acrasis kona]|uniref:Fe2OG dioxygenase domain-containing protein n=1 Tax=Acrasis kona TaxID=1008807 RepID=A0AAW2Z028_9EUKA
MNVNELLGSELCGSLRTNGYAIIDGLFGSNFTKGLRKEIKFLHQTEILKPNTTRLFTHDKKMISVPKKNIFEIDITRHNSDLAPNYVKVLSEDSTISDTFNKRMRNVEILKTAIKVQYNEGKGGSFSMHSDSDVKQDDRVISGVLYLNPDWKRGDGGELKLYPYPQDPVVIEPVMDRLVLFSSPHMVHRVLPAYQERYCLTFWFYGFNDDYVEIKKPTEPNLRFLLQPRNKKHLVKLHYGQEWMRSIIESHHDSETRAELVSALNSDLGKLRGYFHDYSDWIPKTKLLRSEDQPWI